jgi:hypothetical protein
MELGITNTAPINKEILDNETERVWKTINSYQVRLSVNHISESNVDNWKIEIAIVSLKLIEDG